MINKLSDCPLTKTEYGIFAECSSHPESTAYNLPFITKLGADTDVCKLQLAIKLAVKNHPNLSVRLYGDENGMINKRYVDDDVEIEIVDISSAEPDYNGLVEPFELLGDKLYRFKIFKAPQAVYMFSDIHHIVFDGTSHMIFMSEIDKLYRGEKIEAEIMSANEVAAEELDRLSSPELNEAKKYYSSLLDGVDTESIPYNDKKDAEYSVDRFSYSFEKLDADKVRSFCKKYKIKTSTFFYSVFGYVLSKYSNADDFLYSTIFNGRDKRLSNTCGMFVKTFPVYCDLAKYEEIADYLTELDLQIADSRKYDIYSYMDICADFKISPKVMFAYQGDYMVRSEFCGKEIIPTRLKLNRAQNPICIELARMHGKYFVNVDYQADLFYKASMEAFIQTMEKVCNEFLIKRKFSEVELASSDQLEKLESFNDTECEYDSNLSIVDLFNRQVKKTPDNTAVVYLNRKYTYKQLDEISDRIAGYINSLGIGREDVVSILIPRSEYMAAASIGVLKASAGYQPLDPTYPMERLEFMIEDANAKLVIADEGLLNLIPNYKGPILLLGDIPKLPQYPKLSVAPNPEDLFIMLYTSGSTGNPKGCMLEHRNLVAFCSYYSKRKGITESSRVAAYASYGFDADMMDLYPALTSGAAVYIIDEAIRLDLVGLNKYFEENGITHGFMTTQVGRQFASEISNSSLTELSVGGEKLVPIAPPDGYDFYNLYGPTETTVYITEFLVDKLYDRVPIGKPVDNIKLYVLDKNGKRVPIGMPGELCVAGCQVSRGYLNRPEQTEKVFTANPFCNKEGYTRIYHTGDIVRYLPDGNIDFVGRRDGQVKIRGFRIELTEVEGVIRQYEGIKDATVVAYDETGGGKYIAAYIVADEQIDLKKLKDFILKTKPPYMVPAAVMQIDKIPLNVNGKVDKRKLPEIKRTSDDKSGAKADRQLTSLEKQILEMISNITGTSDIDVSDDLMYAGFTSLSIIKLAVQLNKAFGYEVNIGELMKGCTVLSIESDIIDYLLKGRSDDVSSEKAETEYTPLSYTQYGVYSECMKNPYDTFYNIPLMYKFPADFNAEKLAACVKKVLSAHPYVFTRLGVRNDDVVQIRHGAENFSVPVVSVDNADFEKYRRAFVKPFNLMKSRLFRIEVVKTSDAVYILSDFHHIIFDGASSGLFISEIKEAYEGKEIAAESYDYFDYVNDEIKNRSSKEFANAEKYISNMLLECEGADEITPDLAGLPEKGQAKMISIPLDMKRIFEFCAENGVTPAHLFLASMMYVVSRFTNSRSAYINTISNGRTDMRLTDCFGMFVKTLPLGLEIQDVTAIGLVNSAKELLVNSISNEIYPYAEVCRKFDYAPNILFAYQLGVDDDIYIGSEKIESGLIRERRVKFKTAVYIENNNGQECIDVLYNDALYSRSLMQIFANSIAVVVEKIITDPHCKIRKISLLDKKAAEKIESFSQTEVSEPEIKILHELFEKQVAYTPDKTALIACDGKYTYSQLDRRANIIANSLIARGVKKGGRVVILLKRTSKFIASMLGILKAGAAFVPTCPEYPKERIDSIIEDSEAALVITEGELVGKFSKTVDIESLESGSNAGKPKLNIVPEDVAYLIYTSGSTGKPKGVILRHIGIASYLTDNKNNLQIRYITENCSCYGSVTTISFDMSLKETAGSLCNGLTLAFADDVQTVNPKELARFFMENKVDVFNSTPSRLLMYMEDKDFAQAMKNCKVILSGGEKYPDNLLRLLREQTDALILNTYGPTEITVSSNAKDLTQAKEISVGKPLLNYKEYIVDIDDNKLPPGVVGELIIGGCGLALGYNKLPEQTEKAFIEFEGERFYRSGDYARWNEDGDVIILGRKDNQIKLRGLRIELGEIENCLTNIEGIRSAVAVIRKLGNEDGICAYYTADRKIDVEWLKAEMKKTLTDYMIPASFNQLDEFPLTPNGKINIRALSEPLLADKSEKKIVNPQNTAERKFCRIFGDILNIDEVSVTDSFFDLGGTSLTVTRVVIAADKENYSISYGDVFSNPTPRMLAKLVSSGEESEYAFEDIENYNYGNIENVLNRNTLESFQNGQMQEIGNVILTGATGFLGIHVLHELLNNYTGKIYCLLRSNKKITAHDRLKMIFYYYFEEDIEDKYSDRVVVADGDITNKESFDKLVDVKADTFINCAANVKHFSKGTDIEDVNYHGVQNILGFCKKTGIRLVHVSTMSVGGVFIDEPGDVTRLRENQLYFGQKFTSKYTDAKFRAEREVLENAAEGMNVKIMRVGTLSARESDGEYQINFTTNTFMGRLKSTCLIGCYPYDSMDAPFELSPIDYTAKAILLLAQTPKECTIFHPYNNHSLIMSDLYYEMDRVGLSVRPVENQVYAAALDRAKENPEKAKVLSSFIAYQNAAHGKKTYMVGKSNELTMQVLYRMGFKWPVTSLNYMKRFLLALKGLGYFE